MNRIREALVIGYGLTKMILPTIKVGVPVRVASRKKELHRASRVRVPKRETINTGEKARYIACLALITVIY